MILSRVRGLRDYKDRFWTSCSNLLKLYTVGYNVSIYGSASLLLDLGRFFGFVIPYTVDRILWRWDRPVARPLHTVTCLWQRDKNKRGFSGFN
jgi:hypothetical protein